MRSSVVRYGLPAAILAAIVAPALLVASRLPDPIAVHWGLSGAPNGHGPWWLVTASAAVLWCAAWSVLLRSADRWAAASVYGLGGVLLAAHSIGLWADLDAPQWSAARHVTWFLLPAVLVAGVAVGALGWVLAPSSVSADAAALPGPLPSAGLRPGEEAVWWGTAHNRGMLVAVPIAVAAAAVLGDLHVLRVVIVAGLLTLVFSYVRVLVGPTGVQVRSHKHGLTSGDGHMAQPRVRYEDGRPATVPESLEELTGPTAGLSDAVHAGRLGAERVQLVTRPVLSRRTIRIGGPS